MNVKSGYTLKDKDTIKAHYASFDEALAIGGHAIVEDIHGNWRNVKITSLKTWKTRAGDLRIGYKYGLYEYGYIEYTDHRHVSGPQILIEES